MTHQVTSMLETHPKDLGHMDQQKLAECIEACFACTQTCTACADACLSEDTVAEQTRCVRTDLDCADICATTGNVLSRHTGYDVHIALSALRHCWMVRKACGDECERHARRREHCKVCAETCRRIEGACMDLIATVS